MRAVSPADHAEWLRLRAALWPEDDESEHRRQMTIILSDAAQAVFVADAGGRRVGFVEASIHPHAIGCASNPVGYVEGWYVDPALRRRGIGRRLLAAAEAWAASRGCVEMASDARATNDVSRAAHHAAGYSETAVLVHFRRRITPV
ncbi:MAG: GNAT family N-acetyltransferase [Phycisphaerae bacterium]